MLWILSILMGCGGEDGLKGNSLEGDFVDEYGVTFDAVEVRVHDTSSTDAGSAAEGTTIVYLKGVDSIFGLFVPLLPDNGVDELTGGEVSSSIELGSIGEAAVRLTFESVDDDRASGGFIATFDEGGQAEPWRVDGTFDAPLVED